MSESRVLAHHRMGGVPCVRATRMLAAMVVGLLAQDGPWSGS